MEPLPSKAAWSTLDDDLPQHPAGPEALPPGKAS